MFVDEVVRNFFSLSVSYSLTLLWCLEKSYSLTRYIDGGRNGCQTKAFLKVEHKEKSLGGFDAGLLMLVFLTG